MKNTIFFIDGFNFYHSIDKPKYYKYKWIDFSKLASLLSQPDEKIKKTYFFTALTKWSKDKQNRHKLLIKALKSVRVQVVYGKFKKQDVRCRICNKTFKKHIEKQTDVNISVYLFKLAFKNKYDKAYIISADSDLVPAIRAIKESFPKKKIDVIFPIGRASKDIKKASDYTVKIKEKHLKQSMLPDPVILKDGTELSCPPTWK